MAGKAKIGASIALDGEKAFRQAITSINKNMQVLASEMKKTASAYDQNNKSVSSLSAENKVLAKQIEAQKGKVSTLSAALNNSQKNYNRAKENVEAWKKKLADAEKEMDKLKNTSGSTDEEIEQQAKSIEEVKKNLDQAETSYQKAGDKTKDWEKSLNNAEAQLNTMNRQMDSNTSEIEAMENACVEDANALKKIENAAEDTGKEVLTMGDIIKANVISAAVIDGAKKIANGLKTISKAALEVGMNFQHAMSEVQAISGATGKDLDLLTEKAKLMGEKTKFTATQSAEAFKYMAMAGWKTNDMLGAIEGTMNLAAASGEELGTVSDIVTDAMTAFGLAADGTTKAMGASGLTKEVQNATHFADVLAAASSNSNTNVSMMGETFKYVAPLAGSLGFTVEDTALAIGLAANSGIKASQAGTTLRSALTNLVKPTDKMKAQMDLLHLSVTNSDGSMKSLREIMDMLRDKMKTMSDAQRESTAEMLLGGDASKVAKEAMNGMSEQEIKNTTILELGKKAIKDYSVEQINGALSTSYSKKELNKMTLERKREALAIKKGQIEMNGLTQAEQASAAATIFGKQALSGMLAIVNASDKDYIKLSKAIDTASDDMDGFSGMAEKQASIMQDNLTGAVEIFGSAMEGVGLKIYDKFQKPLKEAVQDATNSVDIFSQTLENGALSDSLDGLALKVEDLSIASIGFATDAIPHVVNGLSWLIDNGGGIISTIGGITVGVVALKTATVALNVAKAVGNTITSLKTAETAAMSLTTVLANPYVAAIAGAIAGITALGVYLAKHRKETSETVRETQRLIKSNQQFNDAVVAGQKSRERTREDSEFEAKNLENMGNRLLKLNRIQNKTNSQKSEMNAIVRMLNEQIPDLNLNIDKETGKLDESVSAIRKVIESTKEMYLVKAAQENLNEISKNQLQAELQLEKLDNRRIEQVKEKKKAQENYFKAVEKYGDYSSQAAVAAVEIGKQETAIKNLDKQITKTKTTIKGLGDEYASTTDYMAKHEGIIASSESILALKNAFKTAEKEIKKSGQSISKSTKEEFNKVTKEAKSAGIKIPDELTAGLESGKMKPQQVVKKIRDLINEENKKAEKQAKESGKKIAENESSGIKSGSKSVQSAQAKTNDSLKKELEKGPTEALKSGKDVLIKYAKGMKENAEKPKKEAASAVSGAVNRAKKESQKFTQVGAYSLEGIGKGMEGKTPWLFNKMGNICSNLLKSAKDKLGIKSPSKMFEKHVGEWIPEGIVKGIENKKENAKKKAGELSDLVLSAATKHLDNYKVYHEVSLADEVYYWEKVREHCKKGTQARIDADKQYKDAKKNLNDELKSINTDLKNLETDYKNKVKETTSSLKEELQSLSKAYNDAITQRTQQITQSMGLFDEFSAKSELTGAQLLKNLQSQTDGLKAWANNLKELAKKGIDEGLLSELEQLGPSAAGQIAALNTLTAAQLEEYVKLWKEKTQLAKDQAVKELEPMKNETAWKLVEATEEANKQLAQYAQEYAKSAAELGKSLTVPIVELATDMKNKGANIVISVTSGIKKESKSKNTKSKINTVNTAVTEEIGKLPAETYKIGQDIAHGVVRGVESKTAEIQASMRAMIQAAAAAARAAADIHSPSKLFEKEIGYQMAAGVEVGWQKRIGQFNNLINRQIKEGAVGAGQAAAQQNTYQNGSNTVNIYVNNLDKGNIDEVVDIINKRLGFAY